MFTTLPMDHLEAPIIKEALGWWTSANTVVAVIGAYKGDTVAFVREHSPEATILAFEPQVWASDILYERFNNDAKITIMAAALGLEDGTFPMYETGTDACSFLYRPAARTVGEGLMLDARWVLNRFPQIKLAIINCEGYEHVLLPYLSAQLLYAKVLVQEHKGLWLTPNYPDPWWGFKKPRDVGAGWVLYE